MEPGRHGFISWPSGARVAHASRSQSRNHGGYLRLSLTSEDGKGKQAGRIRIIIDNQKVCTQQLYLLSESGAPRSDQTPYQEERGLQARAGSTAKNRKLASTPSREAICCSSACGSGGFESFLSTPMLRYPSVSVIHSSGRLHRRPLPRLGWQLPPAPEPEHRHHPSRRGSGERPPSAVIGAEQPATAWCGGPGAGRVDGSAGRARLLPPADAARQDERRRTGRSPLKRMPSGELCGALRSKPCSSSTARANGWRFHGGIRGQLPV